MRYLQSIKQLKKISLDLKDKKILSILSENSRLPLTKLSKKVGLSRDGVNYRIKNYEKNGLVQGYRTVVDMNRFEYQSNHLFIKFNNPKKEPEKKIIDKLIKNPNIRAIIKYSGEFDLEIAFVSKNIEDLDKNMAKILSDCSVYLQDHEIMTISKTFVSKTIPESEFKPNEKKANEKNIKPDKKDIEILKIISEDANLPLYEIADNIKLSADAVSYRIKNMMANGIIQKFIPIINYSSMNYNLYSILLNINGFDDKKEKILKMFINQNKNLIWSVKTIGKFNVIMYLLVKNIDELQETFINLRSLFPGNINHYEILIGYEDYKYTYFPKELF